MLIDKPPMFITKYIESIDLGIKSHSPGKRLSRSQKYWLAICIMGILMTNSVCWARFQKACIGKHSIAALSWMFRKSIIPWNMLLRASASVVLSHYGISEGMLAIDDTDKKRSKSTKRIAYVHKIKDKPSGG